MAEGSKARAMLCLKATVSANEISSTAEGLQQQEQGWGTKPRPLMKSGCQKQKIPLI